VISKQTKWKDALSRLRALDAAWGDEACRQAALLECKNWMAEQTGLPRLAALSRQMSPGMSRCQFWCVLVPVEREVSRCKVTDIDILDCDLPPDAPAAAQIMPVTVVLDCVRSAFNVGGIFRSAECFGVAEIVLCGYTPLPTQAQVARVALGTERSVAWRHAEDIRKTLAELKAGGVRCYALETVVGATDLGEAGWRFPCALVLGNERFGLDAETVAACDAVVRIPSFGRKNSLNVVSAFTVAAYEMRRRLNSTEAD
jgi:tRNA G18 (ribose-2'-O)-methylase SpoU